MRTIFLLLSIIIAHTSSGQDTLKSMRFLGTKWKKGTANFSLSTQKDNYYRNQYSYQDLLSNARNSAAFYNFDKSDFNEYNGSYNPSLVYNLSCSLYPFSEKSNSFNRKHELRISLVYYRGSESYISFGNKYSRYYAYGTNALGPDTTYLSHVSYKEIIDQIGIEPSFIFRSPEFWRRFSFFAGIGGGISYSVFSEIQENISIHSGKNVCDTVAGIPYCYYTTNDTYTRQNHKNNPVYTFRGLIPFGLNFRFLDVLSFYLEGRSGISYQKFIHGKGNVKTQYGLGLGIRFNI